MGSPHNPHAGQGMVVLDIGGDIGALLVEAPASLAGAELEICPSGARNGTPDEGAGWWDGEWHSHNDTGHAHGADGGHAHGADGGHAQDHSHGPAWPHVEVLARPGGTSSGFAAVFPGLREGRYDLWVRPDGPVALTADVHGGRVTEARWPASHQ